MATTHHQQREAQLHHLVAEYFNRVSSRASLITITRVTLSADNSKATAYMTVLPKEKEEEALSFAKRHERDVVNFLKKKLPNIKAPRITVELDYGEKHRQHLESILD